MDVSLNDKGGEAELRNTTSGSQAELRNQIFKISDGIGYQFIITDRLLFSPFFKEGYQEPICGRISWCFL